MTPYRSVVTRKAEVRRLKIVEILKDSNKTAFDIAQALRECKYENYSFWAVGDIHSVLPKMLKEGSIQKVGKLAGRTIYGVKA